MKTRTQENLLAALHGEAFAYARYALYAKAARESGEEKVAELFDGLASVELHEHFAELAELAGLVGTTESNLEAAIADENEEVETTYPLFAEQARDAGDIGAVERFVEIAEDELEHLRSLETALERLEVPA